MTVLIVGAGVVGAQVARIEVERGERPVLLDIAPQADAISEIVDPTAVKIVRGDILAPLDLARVIREEAITHVILTAANPNLTPGAQQNPYASIAVNIMGTANVLEAARIFGIQRVVFSSTVGLYSSMAGGGDDDSGALLREEVHPRPTTIYATTKQASENLGLNYARWFGVDFRAVRYAGIYGPWRGRGGGGGLTGAFRDLMEALLASGEATMSEMLGHAELVYSKDAALGTVLACHTDGAQSRVFNVGTGKIDSAQNIAAAFEKAIPNSRVHSAPVPSGDESFSIQMEVLMDLTRARDGLGYEPQYDIESALRDYAAFYRG